MQDRVPGHQLLTIFHLFIASGEANPQMVKGEGDPLIGQASVAQTLDSPEHLLNPRHFRLAPLRFAASKANSWLSNENEPTQCRTLNSSI